MTNLVNLCFAGAGIWLRFGVAMNQVAMITGGSRGIGRGIALELARLGFDLMLSYRSNEEAAGRTGRECAAAAADAGRNITVRTHPGNLGEAEARGKLMEFARGEFQRLDLLVNNAGIAPKVRTDILEASEESFDELVRTNVKGPYFLTQAAAKWMIDARRAADAPDEYRPKIVTISSISAYTASLTRGDYCISKAALSMLTPLYGARLADFGVQTFELRPGVIETDMTGPVKERYDDLIQRGLTPIRRWGQPGDIAKAVAAIALDYFPFSTGEVINVDGGFHLRRL